MAKERRLSAAEQAYIDKTKQEFEERKRIFESKPKSLGSAQMLVPNGDGTFKTKPLDEINPDVFGRITNTEEQQEMLDQIDEYLSNPGQFDGRVIGQS